MAVGGTVLALVITALLLSTGFAEWVPEALSVLQITVVTPANHSKVADLCVQWIDKPAILYSGPEWDSTHIYHFFLDNFVPFFSTAIQSGIYNVEPFWHR